MEKCWKYYFSPSDNPSRSRQGIFKSLWHFAVNMTTWWYPGYVELLEMKYLCRISSGYRSNKIVWFNHRQACIRIEYNNGIAKGKMALRSLICSTIPSLCDKILMSLINPTMSCLNSKCLTNTCDLPNIQACEVGFCCESAYDPSDTMKAAYRHA